MERMNKENLTEQEVRELVDNLCRSMVGGRAELGRRIGKSRSFVSQVISGKKGLTDDILNEVGVERVQTVEYRRKKG
jgi:hypothetical protein